MTTRQSGGPFDDRQLGLEACRADLAQALRVALCGKPVSPPIFDTLMLLGRDEVVARVGKWV